MYTFFVLGQIPGTTITISFTMWIEAAAAVALIGLLIHSIHRRHLLRYLPAPTIGTDPGSALHSL